MPAFTDWTWSLEAGVGAAAGRRPGSTEADNV
jgi:hypothetical protein